MKGKYESEKSFIQASLVDGDISNPPTVVINNRNAYEAICMLCALSGEIVLTHSHMDKRMAIKMKIDIMSTLDSMFEQIINELE